MQNQLIECVPNISEGKNLDKIHAIANVVKTINNVKLLGVDIGKATNRTVITFVGKPENVIEAAFLLIKKAAELINMSKQTGEHPRFGATDVCPLIPIANISMEETANYAHKLGKRVGKELGISGYFYENAATSAFKKNLATVRSGEYEGLKEKLSNPNWKPDFGPTEYNNQIVLSGVTAISARNFLIAYNINLNTTSTKKANAIAFDIRESGRIQLVEGKKVFDTNGNPKRVPGKLKYVKGFGWFIKEYGIAQVSYNLTNISVTSMHNVFYETTKVALKRGLQVTGSELVGLVPLKAMLDAADFFLKKQQLSLEILEEEKIKIAIKYLGLDNLKPFNPQKKIIEYVLNFDVEKLQIINYSPEYAKDFYTLNVAWLKKYFYVEPYDKKVLSNPEKFIINNGGFIFFAKYNNKIIGVVAIINQKSFFELSKMAVLPEFQGLKIGLKLMTHCIEFAKNKQWKSITLYSHRKLKPAISLYKKIGFKEVALEENSHYERSDIKMLLEL